MKLRLAMLCADCEELFEAERVNPSCPACTSRSFLPISKWIPTEKSAGKERTYYKKTWNGQSGMKEITVA